ncbi:MAG TPA: hypothetical protein V6C63_21205 [Allocoleopsis sp.]
MTYLREAEVKLQREQFASFNEERAIALICTQTAILWLAKDELESNLAVARQQVQRQGYSSETFQKLCDAAKAGNLAEITRILGVESTL